MATPAVPVKDETPRREEARADVVTRRALVGGLATLAVGGHAAAVVAQAPPFAGPGAPVAAQTPARGIASGLAASAVGPGVDPALRAAVLALLAQVETRWRSLDTPALEALWDTTHPPLYVAEESTEIHTTFPSLRRYWTHARDSTLKMGLTLGRPDIVPLSADLVTAMYPLHWECLLKGETVPIGGDNRAFSVLRRVEGQWRFTQYVEAPLAPLVYLHQLYEGSVSKDFGR